MKLWYLGDSVLSPSILQAANNKGLELIDSSSSNASMEEVWTGQIHEKEFRKHRNELCKVVIFINDPNYDSEVIINNVLERVDKNSTIILIVYPVDAKASEGMLAHFEGENFLLVRLNSLDDAYDGINEALQ